MSTRVVEQVDSWDEQSFSGGYRALHDLADREFSGVVRAGGAELYMTRGVAVGLRMGDIEDFESAGSLYQAPADALPLLAIMQERNEEVKAKYYSEKTAMSKVDKTLSDGGFTGFIELSENVLSGDYYLVYQAGKSMAVAYVGESSRLLSGDEAFETADDEVGIYRVHPAEIEPVEIPDPEPESDAGGAATTPTGSTDASGGDTVEESSTGGTATQSDPQGGATGQTQTDSAGAQGSTGTAGEERSGRTEPTATPDRQAEQNTSVSGQSQRERNRGGTAPTTDQKGGTTGEQTGSGQRRSQEPASSRSTQARSDLETKSIPSLDPSKTAIPDQGSAGSDIPQPPRSPTQGGNGQSDDQSRGASSSQPTDRRGKSASQVAEQSQPSERATNTEPQPAARPNDDPQPQNPSPDRTASHQQSEPTPEQPGGQPQSRADQQAEPDQSVDSERLETLETELEQKETEIDRLEDELDAATTERDDLRQQVETLESERDELRSEVERLQTELERLEDELGAATNKERRITSGEALAGTDIFVRYRSKGKATLEKAHGASTRKEEVNENLRLEKHTQFDSKSVAVGGQSYDEFLETTLEFQFVRWVTRELLFEVRETGHEKSLGDLYDVLPHIDRAELSGVVDVIYTEDGQETQSQESFDVVLRDRMGHPLLVANLNDSREATTEDMMERLITAAERVGQSSDEFAGAFLVTESFFDPGALEVASAATQGGLLSRDKRESFVNLSRKTGYHLCLVEARNENFHLAVPEL